ncbi:MAG: N-acyl homoserine lactonase family protein [Woeseiaceae bacterium]|nr:N-acyl homoserine lactonase family protein [Woeseiaceae bacterium]
MPISRYVDRTRLSLVPLLSLLAGSGLAADVELWRLDCGQMVIDDISYFSDTHTYDGQSATISNGCYLIRNGDHLLLWDAGIAREYLGNNESRDGWLLTINQTIEDQLTEIGFDPSDVDFLGISHFHGDHIGQAADFSDATLLMHESSIAWIRENPIGNARTKLQAWFAGDSEVTGFDGDHDIFSDGSVRIIGLPGHAPGHTGLLVRLPETGHVLLSGDLYHFQSEIGARIVSKWNLSRADTLASMERFESIIAALKPIVVVQHDPGDIDKLPLFPKSAR